MAFVAEHERPRSSKYTANKKGLSELSAHYSCTAITMPFFYLNLLTHSQTTASETFCVFCVSSYCRTIAALYTDDFSVL